MSSPCGTRAVTLDSFYPTREYCLDRMYFRLNLSFSGDARTVFQEEENESFYVRFVPTILAFMS